MANRVTATEVLQIINLDTTVMTNTIIDVMITTANMMVTKHCTDAAFTATELKEIERWLGAHFCAIRDKQTASEGAGSVSEAYQYSLGLNLQVTMYGQQVMMLDWSGALALLNSATGKTGTLAIIDPIS